MNAKHEFSANLVRRNLMRASRKTKLEFGESNHLITKHRGKHLAKCSAKLRKFSSLGSTVVFDSVSPISENNFRTKLESTSLSAQCFRWRCVQGQHPFPSRTRWLRLRRPMILCWRRHGKVGGCRIKKNSIANGYYQYAFNIERALSGANLYQQGSAVSICWFYQ